MAKEKFERNKPHVNVGTIGHVDHGKTCLLYTSANRIRYPGSPRRKRCQLAVGILEILVAQLTH